MIMHKRRTSRNKGGLLLCHLFDAYQVADKVREVTYI